MRPYNPPSQDVLGELLVLEDEGLEDYQQARQAAKAAANEVCADPMLLAWRDQLRERYWPQYECGTQKRPPWIVWADARGADLTVCIGRRWLFYFLCWRKKDV